MNLGAAIVAAALFKSQLKALFNGGDLIGPPEPPPPPEPKCPPNYVWTGKECIPLDPGLR